MLLDGPAVMSSRRVVLLVLLLYNIYIYIITGAARRPGGHVEPGPAGVGGGPRRGPLPPPRPGGPGNVHRPRGTCRGDVSTCRAKCQKLCAKGTCQEGRAEAGMPRRQPRDVPKDVLRGTFREGRAEAGMPRGRAESDLARAAHPRLEALKFNKF